MQRRDPVKKKAFDVRKNKFDMYTHILVDTILKKGLELPEIESALPLLDNQEECFDSVPQPHQITPMMRKEAVFRNPKIMMKSVCDNSSDG